jgi:carboxylesterase
MGVDTIAGTEPFAATSGHFGVLVLHGFTGSPLSMRPLAERFVDAGFSVELPLLAGHGTRVEDLAETRFADWMDSALDAHGELATRTDRTAIVALSMGGLLALHLARMLPEIAGLVLINPFVCPPSPSLVEMLEDAVEAGAVFIPGIGGDIKRSGVMSGGYDSVPIRSMLSLFYAAEAFSEHLEEVTCPVLLLTSREDHVVPADSGALLEERIGGAIEHVYLENSYHVATLDNDAGEVEERAIAFVSKLMAN